MTSDENESVKNDSACMSNAADPVPLNRRRFLKNAGVWSGSLVLSPHLAGVARAKTPKKPKTSPFQPAPIAAHPLPLSAVRLTGGPLKHAQELDRAYLLALEPDRMMAYYRREAGLVPKAEGYGGWDGDGRNLTGHIAGHYLSAVSLMFAATGDNQFRERADYVVGEMRAVQDARGDGYLGALMSAPGVDGKPRFDEIMQGVIRSGGFDLNGLWSPWYVVHKTFAGLRDAYRHVHNPLAQEMGIRFAAWVESIVGGLTEAQDQQMLATEFGGMNEVLADLASDTGDPRWMALSTRFEHHAVRDPLAAHQDILGGLHANTQIPKLIGSLARYRYTSDPADGAAAAFFWEAVTEHHSFATGGHGKDEYFGPADQLNDRLDGRTAESCNVYNMLKLTRTLFSLRPNARYAEFMERALFNHALGSMDPKDGSTCYMVPVGRGAEREYQDMFDSFTCCVGTGMENHALHGDGIYYENGPRLWVNLYTPSTAHWQVQGVTLETQTDFPLGEHASVRLTLAAAKDLTLLLRRPSWAGAGFTVSVNGKPVADLPAPGTYVTLRRTWKSGDTVALTLPKALHAQPVPDNPRRAALLWGPLVLAGDLGPERDERAPAPAAPVFIAAERPLAAWLSPIPGGAGQFRTTGFGRDITTGQTVDVTLQPFYTLQRRHYAAYWDLYTEPEWQQKAATVAAGQEALQRLDAATVAYAQPGEMQPERDYNEQGNDSTPTRVQGRPGRHGSGWFSFDLPVDPAHPMTLIVTLCTQEAAACRFTVSADGQTLGTQSVDRLPPGSPVRFYDVEFAIPAPLVAGKQKVTVRFQAEAGSRIAGIYGLRMIRADAPH